MTGPTDARHRPDAFPREFGAYQLLGLLGRGGMGTVYEAEQSATGRRVALKMLGQELDSPEMRQRFLREGRLAARVNHPNSLYVFGSEEIDDHPVITMEIAGGGTLKDQLKKRGPLPVEEAVDAVLDVISGLESACHGGVLHRDIKPSNCFVSPDGSVKVGDFGLSVSTLVRNDSLVTAHGRILGTPAYASPEQLRGDTLDLRADIYSVGATLFTLLTDRPPFGGENAVQVVANAVNQEPPVLTGLREDIPPALARVVTRCLAKEPDARFADYPALRHALLPFSSREPEPASLKVRAACGWIDYLLAFLVPYVIIMLSVGAEEFHLRPYLERTPDSLGYHAVFLCAGILYFGISEGVWGAGPGKWLRGLQVVRTNGRMPGIGRALLRILIQIGCVELVRIPLLLATIKITDLSQWTGMHTLFYVVICNVCPWIPVLMTLGARRENGFATPWDLATGTRVVIRPKGTERPSLEPEAHPDEPAEETGEIGPYRITEELVAGEWIAATDPVLRRQVWLLRRNPAGLSRARRDLARRGRLRWLQDVQSAQGTWDAFEAPRGVPFSSLVDDGKRIPWDTLRYWLHDVAEELWSSSGEDTLPAKLSLDHVWIMQSGCAVLLDRPWPGPDSPVAGIEIGDLAGQQRFLHTMAATVEQTSLPLHARPVLRNLEAGKLEKLSFLTGTLQGLLDKPARLGRALRAGAVFMLPAYVWLLVFVAVFTGDRSHPWAQTTVGLVLMSAGVVLGAAAVVQLVEIPFRTTCSHAIFRLAVVDAGGRTARGTRLFARWAVTWLPLILPLAFFLWWQPSGGTAPLSVAVLLAAWTGAATWTAAHPNRGVHDRLAGTWVVRQ
jgi:uncharacterized RDD family membrane protein YckC/tRNA A-37 threonylcarbamoyl transferase component Bud32